MVARPRILITSLTDHRNDGRIARQIRLLSQQFEVISAGTGSAPDDVRVESVSLASAVKFQKRLPHRIWSGIQLTTRQFERYYWSRPWVRDAEQKLAPVNADLVLCNDLPLLPVVIRVAGRRPVIFDAHEYYPRQHEDEWFFRIFLRPYLNALCRRYLPRAAAMLTVSPGLAAEYEREFRVRPKLVRNTPEPATLTPSAVLPSRIRLVHHGAAKRDRQLERLVDSVRQLDRRFELNFFLKGNPTYIEELKRRAGDAAVVFHDPVPNREICNVMNQFDVGVISYQPDTFNLTYCLPNKFFEYIQARLALVVSPLPDMARIVTETGIGSVASDFSNTAFVNSLLGLTPESLTVFKRKSHESANAFSSEVDLGVLLDTINDLLRI